MRQSGTAGAGLSKIAAGKVSFAKKRRSPPLLSA
jgi:hypothetical protein